MAKILGKTPRHTAKARKQERFDMDAIDELVARSKDCPELRKFHAFHQEHPEVLNFLAGEIQLRIAKGFPAFSNRSLWEYARWKLDMQSGPGHTYLMNDHAGIFYGRAIVILHPEFNGRCEFRESKVDAIFGTRVEPMPEKRPKNYARRLQWADGTPLELAWRPTHPHIVDYPANRKPDIHQRPAC
jgi:hypothetical protein